MSWRCTTDGSFRLDNGGAGYCETALWVDCELVEGGTAVHLELATEHVSDIEAGPRRISIRMSRRQAELVRRALAEADE